MDRFIRQRLIDHLASYATAERYATLQRVLHNRTRHVTAVLERIIHTHNASAIIRSAEIFGLQDVHIIRSTQSFSAMHGIARGAARWIDIYQHVSTESCYEILRQHGYRIYATAFHADAISLYDVPLDKPAAFVFGTEHSGVSNEGLLLADQAVTIPMYGFTQSFNVSVSVALCLQYSIEHLRHSAIIWQLPADEQADILLRWLRQSVPAARALETSLLEEMQKG